MIQIDEKSQLEAKNYVLNKTIVRPKTTMWSPVLLLVVLLFAGSGVGIVIAKIANRYCSVSITFLVLSMLIGVLISILFGLKKILILCVECYQHYAPEEYRRLCLCKPTCSEYALIVLKKYNLVKALRLIYIRLTKTCRDTYKIDNP